MSTSETSRFVRLRVELVLDITDADQLAVAALEQIQSDAFMPEEERGHARTAIREDHAEALAYLIDPYDLVKEVPGLELAQASWSSEQIDYDPDTEVWGLDDEDLLDDDSMDADDGEGADADDVERDAVDGPAGGTGDVGFGGRIDAAADDPDATYDPAGGWAGGYRQP
ncbi:hypothetical protein [Streptomyces zagrosensis]|uniref:Uncharacterized protein n=1 Tax=Streptomyces zagrosensis TaxID=1042984 RepID=A0A7W9V1G7_9ACTN|nr:hypothetical protein [Streptomyces zagrosensis]MBB5939180.1 hypothetical protein [Streptomyces zagrosensis]